MNGVFTQHKGLCSDLYGTYARDLTTEYTGYWGTGDLSFPKVGDVYYAHVVVGNVSALPCMPTQLMHLELVLPPNTTTAVSQAYPIRCFWTRITTGVTSDFTNVADPNYACPHTATMGTYGVDLGWVNLPREHMWDVWVPVVTTSPLHGMGSANDKFVAGVNMLAGNGSGWSAPQEYVTVPVNTPTIEYPNPSSVNITNTTFRTQATLNNNFLAGNVYFEVGEVPTHPNDYPDKTPNYAIDAQYNLYPMLSVDWSAAPPNTQHHWRMCFAPTSGATVCGTEQFLTTLAAPPSGTTYTLSVSSTAGGSTNSGGVYSPGASVTMTATPAAGYVFIGWNLDQSTALITTNPYAITMNANHTLKANFAASTGSSGGANLGLSLVASPSVAAVGKNITYALTVTNNGPDGASGVVLTDTLPAGVTFVSVNPGTPTCSRAGVTVTCNLGSLASGASSVVTMVTTPTATGSLSTQATVTSATLDPINVNNSASATVNVTATAGLVAGAGSHAPPSTSNAQKGAVAVPLAQILVTAATGTENIKLGKVTLQAGGTGNDVSDITSVNLYLDVNNNGIVDSGDTLLSSGTYSFDNGAQDFTLATALTITAGTSQTILVTYDFNTTLAALPFATFSLVFVGIIAHHRTRRWMFLLAIGVTLLWFNSCGGGGGGGGSNSTGSTSSTYQATITDMTIVGATSGQAIAVDGFPIAGTTVTVNK